MPARITQLPLPDPVESPQAKPPKSPKKPKNTMPDGRKRIRIDVGIDPATGKRIRKTFVGKTLKECNAKKDAWLADEKKRAIGIDPGMRVFAWIDQWLDTYGQSAGYSANRTREGHAKKISSAVGNLLLTDVKQAHIQAFANSMAVYSKSEVNKLRYTTQSIFSRAVDNGLIAKNPCDGVKWKNSGEGTHRYLERWEISTITKNCTAHFAGTWAMVMLYAGLRRGEALALRWADVDFESGVIHITHGVHFESSARVLGSPKTDGSVRDVPLLPVLADHLRALPRSCDFICVGAHGQPVTQSIWASGWRAYNNTMTNIINHDTSRPVSPGRRSDLDKSDRLQFSIRAHDLRHTYASMLFEAGVDVKTAQKLLGHTTPEMTMRIYTHLSAQQEKSSVNKLSKFIETQIFD